VLPHERQGDTTLKNQFEKDKIIAQQFMMMLIERYNTNIKGNKRFNIPKKVQEATQAYLDENNKVKAFLDEFVEITNNPDDVVSSKHLYDNMFKGSNYHENENQKWFSNKMKENGFPAIRQNRRGLPHHTKQVYIGMKIKCSIENESEDEL
jgi:phage/plasmid-associated DNA primase